MTYQGVACDGKRIDLGAPVSARINRSLDAPADDFTGVFPVSQVWPELAQITITNNNQTIFNGIIDQQIFACGTDGALITVRARSRAALLLDNEALPQTYYLPNLSDIFNRHAAPYGFSGFTGDTRTFSVKYEVEKGVSEWGAIEAFCRRYLNVQPRVTADGTLLAGIQPDNNPLLFSNSGGVAYSSLTYTIRRCDPISDVFVRTDAASGYNVHIVDNAVTDKGICRRRFLNLAGGASTDAQSLLADSKRRYREWKLKCPGCLNVQVGSSASLRYEGLGSMPSLTVAETQYTLGSGGEFTNVVLRDSNL